MRLEWLEDILAVHDTGSLRAAADIRFLTASAFTRRIKTVEQSIGSELFDRSNKPVSLRPHVMELIPRMREVAMNLRVIQNELSGTGNGTRVTRLICQHTLSVSWAPRVARALATNDTQMRIRSGTKDECLFSVLKSDTDVALVYEEPDLVIDDNDDLFERIHLAHDDFLPVAALIDNDELNETIKRKKIPLVTYPRNLFLGEVLAKTLAKISDQSIGFATFAESGLGPAVMEFVREGLGVGWLPSSLIKKEIESGEFTPLTHLLPPFRLNIVALSSKSTKSNVKSHIWKTINAKFGTS